jgi:hypothetical protein
MHYQIDADLQHHQQRVADEQRPAIEETNDLWCRNAGTEHLLRCQHRL